VLSLRFAFTRSITISPCLFSISFLSFSAFCLVGSWRPLPASAISNQGLQFANTSYTCDISKHAQLTFLFLPIREAASARMYQALSMTRGSRGVSESTLCFWQNRSTVRLLDPARGSGSVMILMNRLQLSSPLYPSRNMATQRSRNRVVVLRARVFI
jgi:hypothetical protein